MQLTPQVIQKLEELARERDNLAQQLLDPENLADHERVRALSIKKAALDPVAENYARWRALTEEAQSHRALIDANDDPELVEIARSELPELERRADELITAALGDLVSADDRAVGSVMLEVRAGVGGDEAGIWAADLVQMYQRFAASQRWAIETLQADLDEAVGGVRSCVMNVKGEGVWSALAHEAGTHCVKRVPATETQGRIHTSTATVAVLPEPEEVEVVIDPAEVDEHITTAQGPGGQNVNKVATAVHLIHKPTGVEVRMQETKSQAQNREKAWRLLRARVHQIHAEEARAEQGRARSAQIGSGARSERIRTYRYKEGVTVDHRLGISLSLPEILNGQLEKLTKQLTEYGLQRRIAEL